MRDHLMAEVLKDYDNWLKQEEHKTQQNQRSRANTKGPKCPRCLSRLKRVKKSDGSGFYTCRRHGFVRTIHA